MSFWSSRGWRLILVYIVLFAAVGRPVLSLERQLRESGFELWGGIGFASVVVVAVLLYLRIVKWVIVRWSLEALVAIALLALLQLLFEPRLIHYAVVVIANGLLISLARRLDIEPRMNSA